MKKPGSIHEIVFLILLAALVAFLIAGCATTQNVKNKEGPHLKGAAIGAVAGGVIGVVVGGGC